MKNNLPFVSVIIPAHNEETEISDAIEALLRQNYPKNKIEIIIVDDNSTDRTREVVSKYPVKLFLHAENRGAGAARNTGIKNARGDIVAFTDAHNIANENWLTNLLKHYDDQDLGGVGGADYVVFDTTNWKRRIILECMSLYAGSKKMATTSGSNQSFRKSILEKIGGYDENLLKSQEAEINWRVEKAGYKIEFEPNAKVYLKSRDTFKGFIKQGFFYGWGASHIVSKHPNKITFCRIFTTLFLPLIPIGYIIGYFKPSLNFLLAILLIVPLIYYMGRLFFNREYIKRKYDIPLIVILQYIRFTFTSAGSLKGYWDYIFKYEEKLGEI